VIIFQIYIKGIPIFKTESNPPIRPYRDAPHSFSVAFKLMQFIFMDIHILYALRRRQPRQDNPYSSYQISRKLSAIVFFKIPLQAPMLKTADHL